MINVPDDPERDPQLDAAWREHSSEMPPATLDAAILAAAHRAVGSKPTCSTPQDAGGSASETGLHTRAATGPQRWWMPLAAAATIGAVALGILQTAPQDQSVVAPSATDMRSVPTAVPPRAMSTVASEVAPPVAPPAAPPAAPPVAPAMAPPARDKLDAVDRKDAPLGERGAAAPSTPMPVPAAAPVPRAMPPAAPANVIAEAPATSANATAAAPATSAGKIAARRAEADAAPFPSAPPPAPAAAPQPFPAEKKNEFADAMAPQRQRASDAPQKQQASEAPQRQQASEATAPRQKQAAESPPPARMAAASDEARERSAAAAPSSFASGAAAPGTVALAKTASSADSSAKAIDIDGWIVRIRKLHDEGKLADAAKELVALRAAVPDADRRLPPELRAWAATVKP